ncbi:MGH1-like glycoside hydrolase domain-containing protein [Gaoshiqia sediminis]|uniref:CBM6 domain-containing protein n=1 Tax=Gaoshiqia sediminis TaxID=2986998 RepID=A0AA41Y8V4_9BACT|nr:hypothetical protein [Gaoshiqia sediminis]MCW0483088.1 hypothetical protein [Gaoshiqia sediminis]
MKKYRRLAVLLVAGLVACNQQPEVLYQSNAFTVYPDKVVQGDFEARVLSPEHIVSNYRSTASEQYSRLITFKFSINEKDNEKPSGEDHWLIIEEGEHASPLIQFGQDNDPNPIDSGTKLPVNYEYTFRLDLRHVLEQFNEKGYFEAFDGSRIAKDDFKAVYIAGGAEPLTWDFSNLDENGLALKDPDEDGIFELTVTLNPFDEQQNDVKEWKLSEDISMKPSYQSDQPIVDALFNLSLEEAQLNIEPDSTLRTGAKWGGVWTRDVSYSTLLAFAYHEPEVAKISLLKKVKRDRIIQDTGSGGAWPVSSDRTTWALAAWEIYQVTGDRQWLHTAFKVIRNTLEDDYKTLRDEQTGLYRGESSFLDWREQTYPRWMSNVDIYISENLGTNVVHYQAHIILAKMAKILGEPADQYLSRAQQIKDGINSFLWMKDKGYYGQYLYGRTYLSRSPRFEALGEALAILFDVADAQQAESIVANSPVTNFGTTCIYPHIPDIPPYHNNGIWPFVQSYWNLAAAKVGNEEALLHGLASIYRAGALFLSNYENMVAETGDYVGTEINSHRMLWSMAGNLAMVHRVFMGISFEEGGMRFNPVIPKAYGGVKTLKNFRYRDAVLDISVTGYGNEVASVLLDGELLENAFFSANLSGKHSIDIVMKNTDFGPGQINLVSNKFSPPTPQVKLKDRSISWNEIPGAAGYQIYKNGVILETITSSEFPIEGNDFAAFTIVAIDAEGIESFASEPVLFSETQQEMRLELEDYTTRSDLPYSNYSGNGFIEISLTKNTDLSIPVTVPSDGKYLIDLRYSNGTGPWNTDNNCGIRSLYVNQAYEGVLVFPQRGENEWSDWGYSNGCQVNLKKGKNQLDIRFEDWNTNMDGEINDAMLDYLRVIRIE